MADKKPFSFQEFLQLCKDADALVRTLIEKDVSLQGKRPSILRIAAVRYLARARGFNLTLHHLYLIYGLQQNIIVHHCKLIKKAHAKTAPEKEKTELSGR